MATSTTKSAIARRKKTAQKVCTCRHARSFHMKDGKVGACRAFVCTCSKFVEDKPTQ